MGGVTPRVRKPRVPRIALVDGDGKREYLDALAAAGYRAHAVTSFKEALALRPRPDALIVELLVPDADLSELSQALKTRRRTRALTVVALSGEDRQEAVLKAGATFCRYPCPPEELLEIVRRVVPLAEA
jgi:DNA-binding response OmpR family regulator